MTDERPAAEGERHPPSPHEHRAGLYGPGGYVDAPAEELVPSREVSLARRLLNVRTIGSLVFAVFLLVLLFRFVLNINLGRLGELMLGADPVFLLLALLAYYVTFPLRGLRWAFVLSKVGSRLRWRDATEILYLSWFVNCLVPAKLGDLYRAYLLRGNYDASISRTVGTIFIERIADLLVMFSLAVAAGFWSFRGRNRPEVDAFFLAGFVVAIAVVGVVIGLRFWGDRVARFLPERIAALWRRFHHGSTAALSARSIPVIGVLTGAIWMGEGLRLYFVIRALEMPGVGLGISASVFVALAAALLTAVPLTPAGLGFVEAGIVVALAVYGVVAEPAAAVALTDRAISVLSVVIFGGILYLVSPKVRRAHGGTGPSPSGSRPAISERG